MSLGAPREEKDKSGGKCLASDVAINSIWYASYLSNFCLNVLKFSRSFYKITSNLGTYSIVIYDIAYLRQLGMKKPWPTALPSQRSL